MFTFLSWKRVDGNEWHLMDGAARVAIVCAKVSAYGLLTTDDCDVEGEHSQDFATLKDAKVAAVRWYRNVCAEEIRSMVFVLPFTKVLRTTEPALWSFRRDPFDGYSIEIYRGGAAVVHIPLDERGSLTVQEAIAVARHVVAMGNGKRGVQ